MIELPDNASIARVHPSGRRPRDELVLESGAVGTEVIPTALEAINQALRRNERRRPDGLPRLRVIPGGRSDSAASAAQPAAHTLGEFRS